jgi:hypothetical protein
MGGRQNRWRGRDRRADAGCVCDARGGGMGEGGAGMMRRPGRRTRAGAEAPRAKVWFGGDTVKVVDLPGRGHRRDEDGAGIDALGGCAGR